MYHMTTTQTTTCGTCGSDHRVAGWTGGPLCYECRTAAYMVETTADEQAAEDRMIARAEGRMGR